MAIDNFNSVKSMKVNNIRKPVFSGLFYSNSFQDLNSDIERCFKEKMGPGSLPLRRNNENLLNAVIVPHAGYTYSGYCSAWAYKEIAESKMADVYIIIGPNHLGSGSNSISLCDWETPFGVVKSDTSFAKELINRTNYESDDVSFNDEHSIEVQIPFLQFASRDRLEKLKILAVSLFDYSSVDILCDEIINISKEQDKSFCLIISSDFLHYGSNYGYLPFRYSIEENIKHYDTLAIDEIRKLDEISFRKVVEKNEMTICGFIPIYVCVKIVKKFSSNVKLLQYYTSGDLTGDYANSVSYASLSFK
jgi:AmmeMemoRadiSam system protein B